MRRIVDFDANGLPRVSTTDPFGPAPGEGAWRWIDLEAPTAEELKAVGEAYGFHPVALEDCATFDRRPKLEQYDEHLFVVIHALSDADEQADVELSELHSFLRTGLLVTVHDDKIAMLDSLFTRLSEDPLAHKRGAFFAHYQLCEMVVRAIFPIVEGLLERVETVEEQLLEQAVDGTLNEAHAIRRKVVTLRRVLSPLREVFSGLSKAEDGLVGRKTALYYRGVLDEVLHLSELLESAREHLSNLREAYSNEVSQRTNNVIQRLTVFSVVFLPLSFLSGFFGQNFESLPFHSRPFFWGALALYTATPVTLILWLRSRKWT